MNKSLYKSKTVWLNSITFVLAVMALPEFISIIPASALPYITFINVLGNTVLRVFFGPPPANQ
jgi:hypothetical protein